MAAEKKPQPTYRLVPLSDIQGKTTIIHNIRVSLKLTCREYVFLSFLYSWYSRETNTRITMPEVYKETGIKMRPEAFNPLIYPLLMRLKSKGMIEMRDYKFVDGKTESVIMVSEKWRYAHAKRNKGIAKLKELPPPKDIPTKEEFLEYVKTIDKMPYPYEAVEAYYEPIKNWKLSANGQKFYAKPDWSKVPKGDDTNSSDKHSVTDEDW